MGLLSAEVELGKTMENPLVSFAPLLYKLSNWWRPRFISSRTSSLCGPLQRLCGYLLWHDPCACLLVRVGLCAETPHFSFCFFLLCLLLLYHTVPRALKLSTL